MSQESETVLRNSLDAVDRFRRRTIVGVAALFIVVVVALGALMGAAVSGITERGSFAGQTKVLFIPVIAQMLFLTVCTVVIASYVTRMTKTILKAIELMSNGSSKS
jgi:hypothetical protein